MATRSTNSPAWLRWLGGAVLVLLGAGTLYAVATAILRFESIGV